MDAWDRIGRWCRAHDLIQNRCDFINEVVDGFACVAGRAGSYRVELGGVPVVTWQVYDLQQVECALSYMDAVADAVWRMSCAGLVWSCGDYVKCSVGNR